MSEPRVRKSFERLHRRLQRHFGGDLLLWWKSAEGADGFAVPISCRTGAVKQSAAALQGMGLGLMATDTVMIHADMTTREGAEWPFAPKTDDVFLLAPGVQEGGALVPDMALAVKYRVETADSAQQYGHYRIQAQKHGRAV